MTSTYYSQAGNCSLVFDFGQYYNILISMIKYMPRVDQPTQRF